MPRRSRVASSASCDLHYPRWRWSSNFNQTTTAVSRPHAAMKRPIQFERSREDVSDQHPEASRSAGKDAAPTAGYPSSWPTQESRRIAMGDPPTWECQSSALCAVAFSSASSAPRRPARTAANRLQVEPELRQQPAGERPIGHAAADASARSYQTGSAHRPDRSEPGSARPARQPHNSGTAPCKTRRRELVFRQNSPHSSMPVEFKLPGRSGICTTGCCGTTARGGPDLRGIGKNSLELDFELGGLADRLDLLACQVGGQVGRIAVVQFTLPAAQPMRPARSSWRSRQS